MPIVSFLWGDEINYNELIRLDRLAGSTPHSAHLRIGTVIVSRTQDATQWGSAVERPLLSPYDIINPMQIVSFLWRGDVTCHILIMLDSVA